MELLLDMEGMYIYHIEPMIERELEIVEAKHRLL